MSEYTKGYKDAINDSIKLLQNRGITSKDTQLSDSQHWHLGVLTTLYHKQKKTQGYPFYLAVQDYFERDDGPEIGDLEFAQVIKVFSSFVLGEED